MPRFPLLPLWLLAVTGLSTSLLPGAATAGEPAPGPCPSDATAVIDGLYRWHVAQRDSSGPMDLSSQSQRFTPYLQERLSRALALTPGRDGRFVDFDVFSGTQVATFGARVLNCRSDGSTGLEARVAVTVGISSRGPEETAQILRYRLVPGSISGWRIADITYQGDPDFKLSSFLTDLLEPKR
jgi:hypothetical protein